MIHLEWTDPAVTDLENIHEYLARDSPEYANAIIERLILSVERLVSFPQSGRPVREANNVKVRELIVANYRIIYRLRRSKVQILAVVHSGQSMTGLKPKPWDAA